MNDNYNWKDAANALAQLIKERATHDGNPTLQLSEITKKRDWSAKYTVVQSPLSTWHLLHKKEPNDLMSDDSEVVMDIQGILHQYVLPPFNNEISASSKQWKYLRQAVGLTGLGNPNFESSVKGLINIYAMFNRFVPADKLQANTSVDVYGEHSAINCSNRYFSSRKDHPSSKHIPFSKNVDPKGILTRAVGSVYFQTEDNVVSYYERSQESNGAINYKPIPPVLFREGDVVEAQITMMLVPLKGGQFKLTAVLRCLTLLDSTYSRESFVQSMAATTVVPSITRGINVGKYLKRKIGYSEVADDELGSTQDKLRCMELDNVNQGDNV
ncbi:hypothetical protein JOM56_010121 [Amanita muscaria]